MATLVKTLESIRNAYADAPGAMIKPGFSCADVPLHVIDFFLVPSQTVGHDR